jgi:prevent-host-death family protein
MRRDSREDVMEIAASEFKAKCLELMGKVNRDHEEIVITKRGKPVAKLVAADDPEAPTGYGCMKGTIEIIGDIDAPLDVDWGVDG